MIKKLLRASAASLFAIALVLSLVPAQEQSERTKAIANSDNKMSFFIYVSSVICLKILMFRHCF